MAIIYSYPYVNTVNNSDTLVISVSDTTADNGFLTKSLTADNLASYVTARVNLNVIAQDTTSTIVNLDTQNLTITGSTNEIETRVPTGQVLQIGLPDNVTIANNLSVGYSNLVNGSITVGGSNSTSQIAGYLDLDEVFVGDTLEVDGDTTLNNDLDVGGNAQIDGLLDMTLSRINNVANPVSAQDAATKSYVDTIVSGGLAFKGSFRADTGEILSGANTGSYLYNCPGGAGTRVSVLTGDYYIVANTGGNFYCSGDLLNVGDSIIAVADAPVDSSTVTDWATLESDNIEGTGIANTVPLWTDSQVLGDSMLSQDAGATKVTISGALDVGSNLEVNNRLTVSDNEGEGSIIDSELSMSTQKIINLDNPSNPQDAATKSYVDAVDLDFTGNSGTGNVQQGSTFDILGSGPITTSASGTTLTINSSAAGGTGTTQNLPIWSDGPAGVLGDSTIRNYNPSGGGQTNVEIATIGGGVPLVVDFAVGGATTFKRGTIGTGFSEFIKLSSDNTGFYSTNFQMQGTLAVGRSQQAQSNAVTLDVGAPTDTRPAAWFRNGVVISNNPSGVQIDNTSMVIGAGNNDNVTGSDHCLIVGSGNQITSNSDQSVAFGQGNAIASSTDAFAVGNSNTLSSSLRTQVLGFNNTVEADSSFVAGGGNQIASTAQNMFVLGYSNQIFSDAHKSSYIIGGSNQAFGSNVLEDSFGIGNDLNMRPSTMTLGYRNSSNGVPTPNKNLGLGETKFILGVGSFDTSNTNALIITEGGINGGTGGNVPQIPRIILPTIVGFNFADDTAAAAGGIPVGGLYHNAGALRIRLT